MNMKVNYIDSELLLSEEYVLVLEIENKKHFYRLVQDLCKVANAEMSDAISFIDSDGSEVNYSGKIRVILDYFDFSFQSKKYQNDLSKYILGSISDINRDKLLKLYRKFIHSYEQEIHKIDLPLSIDEINFDSIIKNIKIHVRYKEELIDNLLLLIDLENIIHSNNVLVFVNLKQYLSKVELVEFYKYAIYNHVTIILIDSQCYGTTIDYYEKKLIIDKDLDEFML